MKLHLPFALRKALMACVATLSLPVILPTTLGTASGVVAAWVMLSRQADAAPENYPTINNSGDYKAAAGDAGKNAAGQTWNLDVNDTVENYSFWFQGSPGNAENWSSVTDANLNFMRTLTVGNNGSSDKKQTFNGALTGGAGADMVFSWAGHANTWLFNGNLSGFGGSISSKNGTINVEFGDAQHTAVSTNTGAIKQDGGTVNLTINNGVTVNNSEISVNNLTVNGATSFKANTNITAAGTLNLNSSVTLTGGTLKAEMVVLGTDATVNVSAGARFDWLNFRANDHTLTVKLGDALSDAEIGMYGSDQYGCDLFGARWAGGKDHIVLEAESVSGRKLTLGSSGKVIYGEGSPQLRWSSSSTNSVLNWIEHGAWDEGMSFGDVPNPDVFLSGWGGGVVNIAAGQASVVHVNVDGHGVYAFEYTGNESEGTLNVQGVIYVGDDSTVQVGQGLTVRVGNYRGDGVLSLNGGTVEIAEGTNPVINELRVTESGGTLRLVSGTDAELSTVDSPDGDLRVEGNGGSVTVRFASYSTLKSLTQEGASEVNVSLHRNLTLKEGGQVYGLLSFEQSDVGLIPAGLVLGGDFTVGRGLSNVISTIDGTPDHNDPTQHYGVPIEISSEIKDPVTLIIGERQDAGNDARQSVLGDITIGDVVHPINLVKSGRGIQTFGEGSVDIWGDVAIVAQDGAGALHFLHTEGVEIHGALSGDGGLWIAHSTVKLSGNSNQIGELRFSNQSYNGDQNAQNILELKNDLTVGEIGYCGYGNPTNRPAESAAEATAGVIMRAEDVPESKTLYVLLNPIDAGLMTTDEFRARYHEQHEDTIARDLNRDGDSVDVLNEQDVGMDLNGDGDMEDPVDEGHVPQQVGVRYGAEGKEWLGIGIGKGGEGELRLQAGEDPVTEEKFKLAGSGTLLWVGGTHMIQDFTGETKVVESTDETNPEPEIVGPTLRVTGGTLQLQSVSGTLKTVDLDAREVGRVVLSLGEKLIDSDAVVPGTDEVGGVGVRHPGTLRAYTLKATSGAVVELHLNEVDNIAGWLDIGDIIVEGGPFSIMLTGAKLERIQLFSRLSDMWDGHLKELLLGEGGTGYAWTDLFKIEMNSELLEQWGVSDINELRFRINDEGVLRIETTADYLLWTGTEEDVWSSTHTSGWENNINNPEGKNVRFKKDSGSSIVNIGGYRPVSPKNVDVESGAFIFQNAPGTDVGGLNMLSDEDGNGVLHIYEEAELHLNLRNTSIPLVNLEGILGLGDPGALPEGTRLQFNGGMLLYDTDGATQDVSMLVDGDSSGRVRVAVDKAVGGGVTWGRNDTPIGENRGLDMALNGEGLEKSGGFGNFTLAWLDDGVEHQADIAVTEGSLTLDVGAPAPDEGGTGSDTAVMSGNITGAGTLIIGGNSKVTLSGNNTVRGITLNTGTTTYIKGTTALGGAETVLTLAGGTLTGDNGAEAQAGTVNVTGESTVGVVTLTGAVTGNGALAVEDGTSAGLSGDLTEYQGKLETRTSGTWRLSGGALTTFTDKDAAVSGNGTVQFDGTGTFGGKLEGRVTLRGNNGELTVVTREEKGTGATLAGTVVLGNASTQAAWYDTAVADNSTIYLGNVDLYAVFAKGEGTKLYVRTATSETRPKNDITVNVNGMMDAKELDGITINGHGQLTGITGTYKVDSEHGLELHFSRENVEEEVAEGGESGGTTGGTRALIEGETEDFMLESGDDTGRKIWLDSDAVSEILAIIGQVKDPDQKATILLHLLDQGKLKLGGLTMDDLLGDEVQILRSIGVEFSVREGDGDLELRGGAADVFVAFAGKTVLQSGGFLEKAKATVLSDATTDFTIRINGEGESNVTVHNLLGLTGSMLHLENSNAEDPVGANRLNVTFDNTRVEDIREPGKYPTVDGTDVHGQHTSYKGSIDAGNGVDVTKTGYGTLTVGGNYTLTDGTTTIVQGGLRLRGAENAMEGLSFAYDAVEQQTGQGEENRGLLLEGGTTTVRGAISDGTVEGVLGQGDIKLNNAELVLNGQSELGGTTITSDGGTGKLTLKKAEVAQAAEEGAPEGAETPDPSLVLSGERVRTVLSGVDVDVQAGLLKLQNGATIVNSSVDIGATGTLDLGDSANHALRKLSGEGTLSATGGRATLAEASAFSGTLSGAGTLTVLAGSELQLDNVTTVPPADQAAGWGITVEGTGQDGKKEGGKLVIDVSKKAAGEQLRLGDVNLGSGSTTTINVNAETYNAEGTPTITGSSLSFADNTKVVLTVVGEKAWDYSRSLTLGTYGSVNGNMEELRKGIELKGVGFLLSDVQNVEVDENGQVIVSFQKSNGRKLMDAMPNGAKNAQAGAKMVEGSLASKTMTAGTDYAGVVDYVVSMYDNGVLPDIQGQLSAIAGASVAVLGPALSEDLHRQLGAIRNRTTTMANEVTQETFGQLPLWHAWINAEGSYHKMDADSLAPGYTLNSWGGTVGADVDLTSHVTVGLAVTAMYGDLDADSADTATGDLDTSYLSAFVRVTRGAWIHTIVVSGGVADVKLNRTVNYGVNTYTAHGDTDGYAFGAMYEVGYTGLVNKRGTAALQPVFNVEVRQVSINGYAETGSDAGVDVDDIDQTVVTFGAGVRGQAAVATNAFNRTSVLESRLLLKLDVGDRSGTASNAIVGDKTRAEVESAEVGEVGVEFGAGISVPLGADLGSVFLDGSVEYREGWTSASATLGYRVTF